MIYITGDTHGDKERWRNSRYGLNGVLKKGDIVIVCGDFQYLYNNEKREDEECFLDELSKQPYTILFCDGNHENFPRIYEHPIEMFCGGKVHKIRHNILHLMRGQVYEILGSTFFVMGGGYSIDKSNRVEGISWWPQEMPVEEEYEEARNNLKAHDYKVDYIITHTAPESTMRVIAPEYEQEKKLNDFLQWVQDNVSYKQWYLGHLHIERAIWQKQTVLWFGVVPLS